MAYEISEMESKRAYEYQKVQAPLFQRKITRRQVILFTSQIVALEDRRQTKLNFFCPEYGFYLY